jgi:hypothetical protein
LRHTLQQFKIQTYRLRGCFSSGWRVDLRHALDNRERSAGGLPLPDTVVLAVSLVRSRSVSCEICIGASGIRTCFFPMTSVFPLSLSLNQCFILIFHSSKGRDSSVGIATHYGLVGPGIESRCARFSAPIQTGPGAHPAFCTMGTGSFPGVKAAGT